MIVIHSMMTYAKTASRWSRRTAPIAESARRKMDADFGDMPGAGWSNGSSPGFNGSAASLSAGSSIRRTSLASCNSLASSSSSNDFEIGSSEPHQLRTQKRQSIVGNTVVRARPLSERQRSADNCATNDRHSAAGTLKPRVPASTTKRRPGRGCAAERQVAVLNARRLICFTFPWKHRQQQCFVQGITQTACRLHVPAQICGHNAISLELAIRRNPDSIPRVLSLDFQEKVLA